MHRSVVVAALAVLSVAAWAHTVELSTAMRGMVMGLAEVGTLAPGRMSLGPFLAMWATMMAAMMIPSAAPMVLVHFGVARRRGEGAASTIAFAGGYLAVWALAGTIPFFAYLGIAALGEDAARSRVLPSIAGAVLAAAGVYQLTGVKRACLSRCQSPFAFVASHDFGAGLSGALRAGVVHGGFCLGCCWALMAILLAVGLMNLVWMTAIFALVSVEKTWRHGLVVARVAGITLIALGVAVLVAPGTLARIV